MVTNEQREFAEKLRSLMAPAGDYQVVPDAEGFPIVRGRSGRTIEWLGPEADGTERLYVLLPRITQRQAGVFHRLRAIPGVHRHQTGDDEARVWFSAHDLGCFRAVCQVIGAQGRRRLSAAQRAALRPLTPEARAKGAAALAALRHARQKRLHPSVEPVARA